MRLSRVGWVRLSISPHKDCHWPPNASPRSHRPAPKRDADRTVATVRNHESLVSQKSPTRPFPRPRPIRCYKIGIFNLAARFTEFLAASNL
jgi:hypothetical protein